MDDGIKQLVKRIPLIGPVARFGYRKVVGEPEPVVEAGPAKGTEDYWTSRYEAGGNSGSGSYGKFAEFKAEVLNKFVAENQVQHVIEFGCGDGNQLRIAQYPKYSGYDLSDNALDRCRESFASDAGKSFHNVNQYSGETGDLSLSLDVVYHLLEDETFEKYMRTLFSSSRRHVIVYASNHDDPDWRGQHVRHRNFTKWVAANLPDWKLQKHLPNKYPYQGDYLTGSFADFFFYEKVPKL